MRLLESLLLALVGAYIAREIINSTQAVSEGYYDPNATYPPYDPYSTADPNTAYAGTVIPMEKSRFSPRVLKTSPQQITKIEQFEGRRATAYRDSAGNLTIGVGHLIRPGDGLTAQSVLNDAQINALYAGDLIDAENTIYNRVVVPLSQGEFDALVDFIFQFGETKFGGSTLLALLNQGNYSGIPAEFAKWVNVGGQPSAQVTARRADDSKTFLT